MYALPGLAQTSFTMQLDQGLQAWVDNGTPYDVSTLLATVAKDPQRAVEAFMARERITTQFGFVLPGLTFVQQVGRAGPLVEIGAGRGYLSALLRQHGVDSIATDPTPAHKGYGWTPNPNWPVLTMDAKQAIATHPDRAVLCAWPSYEETWAGEAIATMRPGQVLFLIGEGPGGCTGDDGLFACLDSQFTSLTTSEDDRAVVAWPYVHDRLTVWRKR